MIRHWHIFAVLIITIFTGCRELGFEPVKGRISLSDRYSGENLDLGGEWEFYWEKFFTGDDFSTPEALHCRKYIKYHSLWKTTKIDGWQIPEYGYATYRLYLELRNNNLSSYYLLIPYYDYAVKIFCNNKYIFSNGFVGKTKETSIPVLYHPVIVEISPENSGIEIIMHVSNFHTSDTGIRDEIIIGSLDSVTGYERVLVSIEMIIAGILLVLFIYNICMFILWKYDWISFFFALFCLSSLTLLLANGTCLFSRLGVPWKYIYDIHSISWTMTIYSLFIYTNIFFKEYGNKYISIAITTSAALYGVFVLLTPVYIYTRLSIAGEILCVLIVLYCVFIVARAFFNRREFAIIYFISILVFCVCVLGDFIINFNINQFNLFSPFGALFFIVIQIMVTVKKIKSYVINNEKLAEVVSEKNVELAELNSGLEKIIEERTGELSREKETVSEQNRVISEINRNLEEKVKNSVDELRLKDDMLTIRSRQASMGEMIGFIGHQWKQNLFAVSLYTEGLKNMFNRKESVDRESGIKSLEQIGTATVEMFSMINNLNDFISPGKKSELFSIKSIIDDSIELMHDYITINDVRINRDYEGDLSVKGFPNELKQVFMNLIINSIDAFHEREIKNKVIFIKTAGNDDFHQITVSDNAGGIMQKDPGIVFEKFHTSKDAGSGLGLYISKIVIERRFGGKIEARNENGGAVFTISLPVPGKEIL